MPSLRKTLSRVTEKKDRRIEKEKEHDQTQQQERDNYREHSPPPAYGDQELAEELPIGAIRKLDLNSTSGSLSQAVPSNDECIAHLKFLTALAQLREEISETPDLFGLGDSLVPNFSVASNNAADASGLVKIREKRWAVYVARAVDRFQHWWETLIPGRGGSPTLRIDDCLDQRRMQIVFGSANALRWRADLLPPLDVLMVLHSFMLNPRDFLEDCLRYNMMPLWRAGFPWNLVNVAIDNKSLDYNPPTEAIGAFEERTGFDWDNLQDPLTRKIACLQCQRQLECTYTDAIFGLDSKTAFENSRGFADKGFEKICIDCGRVMNHRSLFLNKFRRDLLELVNNRTPMPGTVLSLDGLPEGCQSADPNRFELFFPNRLLLAGLSSKLLEITDPAKDYDGRRDVTDIRQAIEDGLRDRSLVSKANSKTIPSKSLKRGEKIAIRRMMSNYWDNSSPFRLDLVGAVLRQGIFVQKMKDIDWIHSPALENTMTRLIAKYQVFFKIIQINRGRIAVPTLDVDLAWHTHQLTPRSYFDYSIANANNQFVDHDDKIDETKLSKSFEWTSLQYQKLTGDIYSECTCWYCEAIRESHNTASTFSNRGMNDKALALHDRNDISADPKKNPHISAHNAVKAEHAAASRIASAQAYKLDRDYIKAVRRAQKAGKTPPRREEYAMTYVWGKCSLL